VSLRLLCSALDCGRRAVAWLIAGGSRPRRFGLGHKRQGAFGSLPVRSRGSPVEYRSLLVLGHLADPGRCQPLVQAGDTLVSLGRRAERLYAGGQHQGSGSVCLGGMALGRFQPLADGGLAFIGSPAPFSQLLKPRADGGQAMVDLLPAA